MESIGFDPTVPAIGEEQTYILIVWITEAFDISVSFHWKTLFFEIYLIMEWFYVKFLEAQFVQRSRNDEISNHEKIETKITKIKRKTMIYYCEGPKGFGKTGSIFYLIPLYIYLIECVLRRQLSVSKVVLA